jgi:hypothetical protein
MLSVHSVSPVKSMTRNWIPQTKKIGAQSMSDASIRVSNGVQVLAGKTIAAVDMRSLAFRM